VTEPEPTALPKNNHRRAIFIASAVFLFCLISVFLYWLIWGRFHERTNDAYVNGNFIMITPQEPGIVVSIFADNAQRVEEGQPILELDRHDAEIALNHAKARLGSSVRSVNQLFFKAEELRAKKEEYEARLIRAQLDYDHRAALVADASVSREDYEHSETALLGALAALLEVEKELSRASAQVEKTSVSDHPFVQEAKASLQKAFLSLHRCLVLAPATGIVTQRKAQVGQWVLANEPLIALVPLEQIWVDANFREVDLQHVRIGQPVSLFADMYGRRKKFQGKVVGLNPGTGSIFSILPPQNATGNWIKIVQRVPVKISLDPNEVKKRPLVLGLSMTATIDTHDRSGERLPTAALAKAIYQTDVYVNELAGADALIKQIIKDNSSLPVSYSSPSKKHNCIRRP
jgi:Multidrug resistance efflux pump